MSYQPKNNIRIVTAASLFDGHDATINIIRRILQDQGAEVIHLGHNRSVKEIVDAALQEGAQGICVSSYQGGHMEFFKYMRDMLNDLGAPYVKIFGGGGGVIVHEEKAELEKYGIEKIFHPDDGRKMGLDGMIELIIKGCDFDLLEQATSTPKVLTGGRIPQREIGLNLTAIEHQKKSAAIEGGKAPLVLGITGTGGAGKSSLIDELLQRFLNAWPEINIAVLCVDPSKKKTGGALLGDRIRMNSLSREGVFMRSLASRGSGSEISSAIPEMLKLLKSLNFNLIIVETSGIGQSSMKITEVSDKSLYVMTAEFGAPSQLEKIDMLDYADFVAINKADHRGSKDALRDVKKQYGRSRKVFGQDVEGLPVFLTQASQFNDVGINQLFFSLCEKFNSHDTQRFLLTAEYKKNLRSFEQKAIVPPERQNYLAEIVASVRGYKNRTKEQAGIASLVGALEKTKIVINDKSVTSECEKQKKKLPPDALEHLESWNKQSERYKKEKLDFQVREKTLNQDLTKKTLSGTIIRRVTFPNLSDWGDRLKFLKLENVPGEFPYTAGVFPLKRLGEDPKRMFAGEGTPERTNKRFHYLSQSEPAKRLSTAFDSVTLYGHDPDQRPDIYGKVGESGVSICTIEDMEKLYDGFDLCAPSTSVSMTINGPAPMILAFYMNTAINQQVRHKESQLGRKLSASELVEVKQKTLTNLRGTVQADILKEDQGQNTCIFSIDFALKVMGDIQEYFSKNDIRNFYSVSISGYHIAEAGANPISQLAFTLSNGFTFVEYYLSRGMKVDEFAPNLSFFFSNGMDAEYTVLGRVARRIWSIAMRDLYQANERSQKLKYHIQTSGRSLHAQEIQFNDIRTTLQALIALFDNCNSLHTNAYDEAITTPTEESVRRAMAIQMIVNKEFGWAINENPLQGSYFIDELTELVEEAVLDEFLRISERGGVLGAMETQYQRSQIQAESLLYEHQKHSGELPIVGVNTFIDPKTLKADYVPPKIPMARATIAEKEQQRNNLISFQKNHKAQAESEIKKLKDAALQGRNIFEALMSAAPHCSLYQMTQALYEVGGQYRRNI
ncbi:MAG: fused isobutyryl-CoA mutase/GTPase IcmF [Pseudomonadota bacterium]|nr:fused isobutyryl-CoA mutase/GTPase IcmF [Pseudomonadota bacterium]